MVPRASVARVVADPVLTLREPTRFRAAEAGASVALHALAVGVAVASSLASVEEAPPPKVALFAPVAFGARAAAPAPRSSALEGKRGVRAVPRAPSEAPATLPEPESQISTTDPLSGAEAIGPLGGEGGTSVPFGDPGAAGSSTAMVASPIETPPLVVRIADLRQAQLVHRVTPAYPAIARAAGISGVVVLDALVGPDGRVVDATALSGNPLFEAAARDAVLGWRYEPLLLNGVPTAFRLTVTVRFTSR